MAHQEVGGHRGVFNLRSPSKEAPTLPIPPTEPAFTPEPGKPPTKKSLIKRLRNILAGIVLAGTTVAGTGYALHEAYQNNPAVHQDIDKLKEGIANSWNDFITPETPVVTPPDVYDKNALAGTISKNNSIIMSKEEAKQLFPQPIELNEQTRTATIFNFLEPPEGETITWTRIPVVNSETGILMYAWRGTLPAGTKIKVSPVSEEYISNGAGYLQDWKGGKNPERGDEIWKFFYDPSSDTTTVVNIGSVTGWFVFPPEMQGLPTYASIDVLKKFLENTLIATTTQPTQVDINIKTIPGKSMADPNSLNGREVYSPNFYSIPSSDGVGEKIVDVK